MITFTVTAKEERMILAALHDVRNHHLMQAKVNASGTHRISHRTKKKEHEALIMKLRGE